MFEHYTTRNNNLSKRYTTTSEAYVYHLHLICPTGYCYSMEAVWMIAKNDGRREKLPLWSGFVQFHVPNRVKHVLQSVNGVAPKPI